MEMKDPIKEAQRYIENAKTLLKEKAILNPETRSYEDSKYVKLAGHALWTGAIIALCYSLKIEKKPRQRLDIKDFQEAASKRNKKLLGFLVNQYQAAHIIMGYDGYKGVGNAKDAIYCTQEIVDWCDKNRPKS